MIELWLVRHGSTEATESRQFAGWEDLGLTDRGRNQISGLGVAGRFRSIISSDLCRCVDTARLLGFEPRPDERWRELDFGAIEGLRWDDLDGDRQAALVDFDRFQAPGGESVAALKARVWAAISELESGRHLVVTHGGVIRMLLRGSGAEVRVEPGELIKVRVDPVDRTVECLERG
jgi:probable phosphoglycerate mutase